MRFIVVNSWLLHFLTLGDASMANVTDTFTTASGTELEQIEYQDQYGNTQKRWRTKSNNEFRTQEQVEQIKEQTRQRNEVRKQAIEKEFPEYNNTEGLNPNRLKQGEKRENIIKAFMDNGTVKSDVANNPLLEGQNEYDNALEARARQILKDFEEADTEAERNQIKRKYNLQS